MDVAFYHDDPSNRIAAAYDPQSSPGSVDSISSTDAGPVCAIAAVPPAYRDQRFGQDFAKTAILKGMNLNLQAGSLPYSTHQQQIDCRSDNRYNNVHTSNHHVVSSVGFQQTNNTYSGQTTIPSSSIGASSANNLCLAIPDSSVANTPALSTPDLVNMIKVGSTDFDQMLSQYSQAGPQVSSQLYTRNLAQEELYAQSYARQLERQKTHGGSNPNIASNNPLSTGNLAVAASQGITSSAQVDQTHPHQFVADPAYYHRDPHHEGPSTSAFGVPASTIHHMGNPPIHPAAAAVGQHVLMSPHVPMVGHLKEEPQTVPVASKTPPMSPIDMEHQELIKTERKRLRNRLAASKCRKRKLERISRLEEKVNNLKTQNLELSSNANLLRQQVTELKSKVMTHVNSGCQLMMSQQQVTF